MLNEHVARRGLMFVLSSPSGAGKSTLAKKLLEADDNMSLSVSATTRAPRPSEVDGREYKFLRKEQFEDMADRGEFLEHAMVFGNHYGTPRAPVEAMPPFRRPGAHSEADFALETGRQLALRTNFLGSGQQGATRRLLGPAKSAARVDTDPALGNALVAPGDDMCRHGIEQFVSHDHPGKAFGQGIQPFDTGQQVRGGGGNRLLLPLAQIGRQIEYAVTLGQAAQPLQFEQQVGRQAAGAGPHFKYRGG